MNLLTLAKGNICIHYCHLNAVPCTLVNTMYNIVAYLHLHRSEIHENLKCSRCDKDGNSALDGTGFAATDHKASIPGVQDYADIGRFGEISGCLQKMNSAHHQVILMAPYLYVS
jgi:hypothetical protein